MNSLNRWFGCVTVALLLIASGATAVEHSETAVAQNPQAETDDFPVLLDLETEYPDLFKQLEAKQLLAAIEPTVVYGVEENQIASLTELLQPQQQSWTIETQGLTAMLDTFRTASVKPEDSEWWKKFKEWLKSFNTEQYDAEFDWLVTLLLALLPSEQTLELVTEILIYLLVLTSVGLVVWEFYLAGVFQRRSLSSRRPGALWSADNENDRPLNLAEIEQLPEREQIPALMQYVIGHLTERQQLPEDRSLTNRQFLSYLQRQNPPLTSAFRLLLLQVEPILYGGVLPTADTIRQCRQHTETLCSQ